MYDQRDPGSVSTKGNTFTIVRHAKCKKYKTSNGPARLCHVS